jgi:hypothetical protein
MCRAKYLQKEASLRGPVKTKSTGIAILSKEAAKATGSDQPFSQQSWSNHL